MILLHANDNTNDYTNVVVLTLTEKVTLTSPLFLFRFVNDMTGHEKVFAAADVSTAPDRYNKFVIMARNPNQTEDLTIGEPILSPTGYWTYEVGEIEQTSPQSIDWADITSIVETGKVLVYDSTENPRTDYSVEESKDNTVFFEG